MAVIRRHHVLRGFNVLGYDQFNLEFCLGMGILCNHLKFQFCVALSQQESYGVKIRPQSQHTE